MLTALSLSPVAVRLIELYQRFLSPLKGFACAYRCRNRRRSSCSQFAKRAFARRGIFAGFDLLDRRFAKCSAAAKVLEYEPREKRGKPARAKREWDCDPVSGCDAAACPDLPSAGCDALDVGGCDCSL